MTVNKTYIVLYHSEISGYPGIKRKTQMALERSWKKVMPITWSQNIIQLLKNNPKRYLSNFFTFLREKNISTLESLL